jgi:radical SAM-linked protein
MSHPLPRYRYRLRFSKRGPLRYISHLDLARVWERMLRRVEAPLVYSQGFNPRPKIQLAAALPLGYESTCEVTDVWLEGDSPPEPDILMAKINEAAPEGLLVHSIEIVDLREASLQSRTQAGVYRVEATGEKNVDSLRTRLGELLGQDEIWREQRSKHGIKQVNIRPLIYELTIVEAQPLSLHMKLSLSQEKGTLRPDHVLEKLGLNPTSVHVTRTAITF